MTPESATKQLLDKHVYTRPIGDLSRLETRRGELGTAIYTYDELPDFTRDALARNNLTPQNIQFGSATISSFQLDAPTPQAGALRKYLDDLSKLSGEGLKSFLSTHFKYARKRIGEILSMPPKEAQNRTFFGHSGTHLIQTLRYFMPGAEVICLAESGTTMPDAYKGLHLGDIDINGNQVEVGQPITQEKFGMVHTVSVRNGDNGKPETLYQIKDRVLEIIKNSKSDQIIVHLPVPSKTAHSPKEILEFATQLKNPQLMQTYLDRESIPDIIVVLDMAQTRHVWDSQLRDPTALGLCDFVLFTGSKALAGNGFSGCAVAGQNIIDRMMAKINDTTWRREFDLFASRYIKGGHLPNAFMTQLGITLPFDSALMGRLVSVVPTLTRLKEDGTIKKYIESCRAIYNNFHKTIDNALERFPNEFSLDIPLNPSSVFTFSLPNVADMKLFRALMMQPMDPKTINNAFGISDQDLLDACALPFELPNPVSEEGTCIKQTNGIVNVEKAKHPEIGRIAISFDMVLDWKEPEKREIIEKSMRLLALKMAFVGHQFNTITNTGFFSVSDLLPHQS